MKLWPYNEIGTILYFMFDILHYSNMTTKYYLEVEVNPNFIIGYKVTVHNTSQSQIKLTIYQNEFEH